MMNKSNNERYGMSGASWNIVLGILEITLDIIKGVVFVGGVLCAALADMVMGALSITILFGTVAAFTATPAWIVSGSLSMAASAFQIYLFSVLQKRGIGVRELMPGNWRKLPKDVVPTLITAGIVWLIDTISDVAPVILLVQESRYKAIPELYLTMVFAVIILVAVICGFSEILTSNMRSMLQVSMSGAYSARNEYRPVANSSPQKQEVPTASSKVRNTNLDQTEAMKVAQNYLKQNKNKN